MIYYGCVSNCVWRIWFFSTTFFGTQAPVSIISSIFSTSIRLVPHEEWFASNKSFSYFRIFAFPKVRWFQLLLSSLGLKWGQACPLGSKLVKWKNLQVPLSKLAQSSCLCFIKSVFGSARRNRPRAFLNQFILDTLLVFWAHTLSISFSQIPHDNKTIPNTTATATIPTALASKLFQLRKKREKGCKGQEVWHVSDMRYLTSATFWMIWYTFGVLIHLGFLKYTKFSFWHTYSNPVSSSDFISSCVCATSARFFRVAGYAYYELVVIDLIKWVGEPFKEIFP